MRSGFDYADIIEEVTSRALGEDVSASDIVSAKRSIYMVLEDWHAQQFNTWRIKTLDAGFGAGTPQISLPTELDDVLNVSVLFSGESTTSVETPMERVSETEYAQITNKGTAGMPSVYVLRRTEPPMLLCHPAGRTGRTEMVRITYIQRPDIFDRHSTDIDAPARWLNPLILGAAADLAFKNPDRAGERVSILAASYTRSLGLALANDRQRASFKMRIR